MSEYFLTGFRGGGASILKSKYTKDKSISFKFRLRSTTRETHSYFSKKEQARLPRAMIMMKTHLRLISVKL